MWEETASRERVVAEGSRTIKEGTAKPGRLLEERSRWSTATTSSAPLDDEPFCSLCFLTYDDYKDGIRVEIHTSPTEAPVVVPIPQDG